MKRSTPKGGPRYTPPGERRCTLCGCHFPRSIVFVYSPIMLCGICSDELWHGRNSVLNTGVIMPEVKNHLHYMHHWMGTVEGGYYIHRNMIEMAEDMELPLTNEGVITMITPEVTVCFVNVFAPRPTPDGARNNYSLCAMLDKTDAAGLRQINAAIQDAVQKGIEKGLFSKSAVGAIKLPLRDGDAEVKSGARGPEFAGKWFFNCARVEANGAPEVVKSQQGAIVPILDQAEFYSGCIARLDVNFYPFNKKANKGIAVGLNSVLKVRDGERLDGRVKAETAFSNYADLPEPDNTTEEAPF